MGQSTRPCSAPRLVSYCYLQKPCETEELLTVLREAYTRRVQRRLELDAARMEELLSAAVNESPLAVLRRLKQLDASRK